MPGSLIACRVFANIKFDPKEYTRAHLSTLWLSFVASYYLLLEYINMYKIDVETYSDMVVFHVSGTVLLPNAIQFQQEIIQLFRANKGIEAVMDLSQVDKMDNSGLGVLVNLSNRYTKQGRIISLYSPTPSIEKMIKDIGIEKFFAIYENEEELKNHSLSDAV